jgi:hypothetical protein
LNERVYAGKHDVMVLDVEDLGREELTGPRNFSRCQDPEALCAKAACRAGCSMLLNLPGQNGNPG